MADQKTTVARARMTDAEFSRLYAEHHAALVRFVNGMVRDTSLAQDVAQDAFLRAHSAVASFGDVRAASAWLRQTARRIVIDEMRHRKVVPMSPLDDSVTEPVGNSAESEVVARIVDASTSGAIARLPDQQRAALLLTAEGYGGAEMATKIGVSHGAARVLLHRARRATRDDMAHGVTGTEADPAPNAPFAPGD